MDNLPNTASVNFLRARKKEIGAQEKIDRKYAIWMSYLTTAVLILFIFVFGIEFFFNRQISRVEAETVTTTQQINSQKSVEEELLALAEKLSFIEESVKDREKKREAIAFFTKNFSTSDTSLREISFGSEGILQFQLVSNDIFILQKTVEALQGPIIRERYSSVNLSDISRDNNGAYRMQVIVVVTGS